MQVLLADHAGFCFGVQRALDLVEDEVKQKQCVATYGPLIHNPQVVERLARQGVKVYDDLQDRTPARLVIRSHGVGPEVYQEANEKNFPVVDATCPFVKKVQTLAQRFTQEGYQVVIAGDRNHPEVQGILAWSGSKAFVVANGKEAASLKLQGKVALIAQTTLKEATLREIEQALRAQPVELELRNTICAATGNRQKAARQLVNEVDVMVVVGGRNSSNTVKLAQICRDTGVPTYHIEEAAELKPEWFTGKQKAGVTAGASTPRWIIEEVIQRMTELNQEKETEFQAQNQEIAAEVEDMGESFAESLRIFEEGAPKEGGLVTGTVVKVRQDEVLVDVGGKSEGVIPLRELATRTPDSAEGIVKVGDEVKVVIVKAESEDGNMILSRRRAIEREKIVHIQEAKENDEIVTGEVIAIVKGGLRVDVGVTGFVPASQVDRGYVENLDKYIGQTLRMKVMEIDTRRNNCVLSAKAVLEEEYKQARGKTWEELAEGQTRRGTVRRLSDFGAFVDLGGVDGLLHISEMSWGRIKHPSEIVKEGDVIDVFVLKVDREKEKVSLGLKQVLPNPWDKITEKYPIDSIITVTIVRLTPFGAFAELEPGVDGLIHISQLADRRINKPDEVVSVGDQVKVKVLDIKEAERRISLSMRAVKDDEANAEVQEYLANQDNQ
ncbi:bifunctional 4-hydroxy-3-methylbut-2-enyl diphosphate reductase/30S ribosomal protein S1 [Heliobacterium chlorum]|uniref:4-hydroxy-3-methylbut-2-enyl diphosphate reductase n=1 Tax=Heliobacterium chlorum TaxID=2698 RepID=A0ABR7SX52_HELCL|nr:bifunctional 4-hydroxy-3-methylbut-2-enyl diphosphate reductase/30S ribosomal protein S1 [Heliobacterium chlorum]MBC9783133.1 bifunctional 4-hydroxy-3-methylbut-2-enyl diphosphate reductase/30S ribosomal protein S1 [Heliobacterium chlorum]